ncbi:MAG: alpha/beta fold hydrolase [Candidatus Hodarchaeales archaeon]|jgi:pimeloyl-ACP methyl ester carboxylesterase
MFIHGLGGNIKVWKQQKSLSLKYKLVFIDLAGHGKSGKDREVYTMQSFAKDVKTVVNKFVFRKLFLIGCSMGGISHVGGRENHARSCIWANWGRYFSMGGVP